MGYSILVVANTYYQLITAIQLRENNWKNHRVDIVISNQSNNAYEVYEKLKEMSIFDNVYFDENVKVCVKSNSLWKLLLRMKSVFLGHMKLTKGFTQVYDELVYYNADVHTYGIFADLWRKNRRLVCSRYEEGVLSYSDSQYLKNSSLKYINKLRNWVGADILEERTIQFYCFYPDFYQGKLSTVKIPVIKDTKRMGRYLCRIFALNSEMFEIPEKYIFFSSVYDFEGGDSIGEFELVNKIATIVGRENLLVKTHPRDQRDIYTKEGLKVYRNSSIPWEAIQINNDCSDKVFLTVNSGSVLGVNLMLKVKSRTYFMYNCCEIEKNRGAIHAKNTVERVMMSPNFNITQIKVLENIEEFIKLEKENGCENKNN